MLQVSKLEFVLRKNAQHFLQKDIRVYIDVVAEAHKFSEGLSARYERSPRFDQLVASKSLEFQGQIDLVTEDALVGFVFGDQFGLKDAVRMYLKGLAFDPRCEQRRDMVNLRTGALASLAVTAAQSRGLIREAMVVRKRKIKNAIIVYDFETTGLDTGSCEVIDRCFYDCDAGAFLSHGLVQSAFVPPEVEQLTGISTAMLRHADRPAKMCAELREILDAYEMPWLVAHNGARFDDKILLRYMGSAFGAKVRFADSMHFLPVLVKAKTKKLQDLYSALFADKQIQAHRAEADVLMLDRIICHPSVRPSVDKLLQTQSTN